MQMICKHFLPRLPTFKCSNCQVKKHPWIGRPSGVRCVQSKGSPPLCAPSSTFWSSIGVKGQSQKLFQLELSCRKFLMSCYDNIRDTLFSLWLCCLPGPIIRKPSARFPKMRRVWSLFPSPSPRFISPSLAVIRPPYVDCVNKTWREDSSPQELQLLASRWRTSMFQVARTAIHLDRCLQNKYIWVLLIIAEGYPAMGWMVQWSNYTCSCWWQSSHVKYVSKAVSHHVLAMV